MKAMIARKRRQFANRYKVIYGRQPFRHDMVFKGDKKEKLTKNDEDPLYTINFNDTNYVIKQVGKHGEDEWDVIVKMITRNLKCPLMIDYYACIRSMINHKRFIMMRRADTDLKDYLVDNSIQVDRKFVDRLLPFVFQFQLWCINNLNLVYTDMKCRNILLLLNNKKDVINSDFEFRMADIGLMEDAYDDYDLDEKMLNNNNIINFMFPRRECTYQQVGLFVIAMLIFEISVIHMKAYGDSDNEEFSSANSSKKSLEEELLSDYEKLSNDVESVHNSNNSDKDDSCENDNSCDNYSEFTDESDNSNEGFIGLLDGRPTDDNLDLVLSKLPLFSNGSEKYNEDLLDFLIDLLNFKYETVEEAYNVYSQLNHNVQML